MGHHEHTSPGDRTGVRHPALACRQHRLVLAACQVQPAVSRSPGRRGTFEAPQHHWFRGQRPDPSARRRIRQGIEDGRRRGPVRRCRHPAGWWRGRRHDRPEQRCDGQHDGQSDGGTHASTVHPVARADGCPNRTVDIAARAPGCGQLAGARPDVTATRCRSAWCIAHGLDRRRPRSAKAGRHPPGGYLGTQPFRPWPAAARYGQDLR